MSSSSSSSLDDCHPRFHRLSNALFELSDLLPPIEITRPNSITRDLANIGKIQTNTNKKKRNTKQNNRELKLFHRVKAIIISSTHLSKKQAELIQTKIFQYGGSTVDNNDQISPTHVILAPETDFNTIQDLARIHPQADIIDVEWVSKCILQRERLPIEHFRLNVPQIPEKAEKLEPCILPPEEIEEHTEKLKDRDQLVNHEGSSSSNMYALACQADAGGEVEAHDLCHAIAEELDELGSIYGGSGAVGGNWRQKTYKKAASLIKSSGITIRSIEDVKKLASIKGIGNGVLEKVQEIVLKGSSSRLQKLQQSENFAVIQLFSNIWGVGPQTARSWFNAGMRTLEDVSRKAKLSSDQQIGLKYYEEFKQRIPRDEVTEIVQKVERTFAGIDPSYIAICCGSYRRGKPACGDVDILITHEEDKKLENLLDKLIPALHSDGIITDDLRLTTHQGSEKLHQTYMGVCLIRELHRRIDIKTYTKATFPFAILYFTGNDYFNRSMRYHAKRKGLSLTDKFLRYANRGGDGKVLGAFISCTTEEDVFRALELEYRTPEQRNCGDTWIAASFSKEDISKTK